MNAQDVSILIDQSPMNRGLSGAAWVGDTNNRAICLNGNVMLFEQCGPAVEFHWLKTVTGARQIIQDTREAMRTVFRETGASLIFGLIPDDRPDSKIMARWVGAKPRSRFETPHGVVEAFAVTPELLGVN